MELANFKAKSDELAKGVAYSYIRFSTPEQLRGDSLRRQTEASEEYAKEHGLILDHTLKLQDLGVSAYRGKNAAKGALAGFFEAILAGKVKPGATLLVESLDRLSRDQVTSALTQFMSIINSGITVVTLMDRMRYSVDSINANPGSLMMSLVIMMRAHEESATKATRVAKAWSKKRERAQQNRSPLTKRCPAWLTLQKTAATDKPGQGIYVIIPDRAALVRRIFHLAADGLGKRKIADVLNNEELPTWGDKSNNNRPSIGWHPSYIQKIIHSPAAIGIFQPHKIDPETRKRVQDGEPIPDYFPAVISPAEWNAAHGRPKAPRGPRPLRINNLFTGLVYDGYTGATMRYLDKSSSKQARNRGDQRYLRSDIERRKPGTKGQNWPYWHFEATVLKYLRGLDWSNLVESGDDPQKLALQAEQARLAQETEKDRAAITRILDSFASDDQPAGLARAAQARAAELANRLEAYERRLKDVQAELATIQASTIAMTEGVEEFKRLIADGGPSERLRLQTEIRRRVKAIHCYRHGIPNEFGLILCAAPALEIEYHRRTIKKRWIVVGTDNPLTKPRVYDQPRDPQSGAYISRNQKNT